ncbi:ATP-grasp domain-containing protein [Bacillus sp. BRMEA1]|uniref:carboxylate--amine ligase n=1 Tax=Neobacillus endophyticus TaxID=2738405 RepID=UPI00156346A0|nr:ATP-grasp domain-containing protein [Neobacillus endophyticus]NRD77986.1 ATP-grasp domain-containing protein [Neobacillus endophyticus]
MQTVIITDGLLRKSLSATRSLGKRGIKTIVGDQSSLSPSGFSKHCYKRVKYPDPKLTPEQFLSWLKQQLKQENVPVLLPMDDAVVDIVMEHWEDIKNLCKCLLPSRQAYDTAADKFETIELARKQSVKCPETYLPNDKQDVVKMAETAVFPLVVKPRKSSGSRGIRKVENKESLLEIYEEIRKEYPNPMIQECIPFGDRYDVCLLYDQQHEVKASFVQKEIRHFPIKMGPSTVQESVSNEELIELSIHLLKPLNWTGIVEVEYMIEPRTNQPVLMEINPRFWNSLDLAIQSGIDFPYLLYQLCLGQSVPVQKEYPAGRRSRWLFPGDLLHFLLNPERFSMKPSFFSGKKQSVFDDTFSLADPLPGVMLILCCVRLAFSIKSWKMFFKR